MISPLSISTHGWVSNSSSKVITISTHGWITPVQPVRNRVKISEDNEPGRAYLFDHKNILYREDEEVIQILSIAIKSYI